MQKKSTIKIILALILLLKSISLIAQASSQINYGISPSIQSPNVSALGKFGNIPVSPYNGTVNISIPITEIKTGEITVPISLSYDSQGCKTDGHPTWVGLNWALNAGGIITRQTNGPFDEFVNVELPSESYVTNFSALSSSNWSQTSFLSNSTIPTDLAPDQFNFSFNGISGCFMLNDQGKWVVQSKDNLSLQIISQISQNYNLTNPTGTVNILPRAYTEFIITTGDGTKYIFGNDPNAIEFSRVALPSWIADYDLPPTAIDPGDDVAENPNAYNDIQPSSWLLSEIISPTGHSVTFHYDQTFTKSQITYSSIFYVLGLAAESYKPTFDVNLVDQYLINSAFLDNIETDNGIVCTFSRSVSNELTFPDALKPQTQDDFSPYNTGNINIVFPKLDELTISVNNTQVKDVRFSYIENASERLKLQQVSFISPTNSFSYSLAYNSLKLPAYNVGQNDHWGYYNGKNYWNGAVGQDVTSVPNTDNYYASRTPDTSLMQAEILSKITYPMGGYSLFYFEPNNYGSMVLHQGSAITLQATPENPIGGGLRIRRIEDYDGTSTAPITRDFYYTNNYINSGTGSSGILSQNPIYNATGQLAANGNYPYYEFNSNSLNQFNTTNGGYVTYSEVTEVSSQGYKVDKFTNQDNGYLDKPPINELYNNGFSDNDLFGALDLERGLLINEQYYTQNKTLIQETINTYNNDPTRYNNFVKSVNWVDRNIINRNIVAYPIYTFYPYLQTKTVKKYSTLNSHAYTLTTSYTYNADNRLLKQEQYTDSQNNQNNTYYFYPTDYFTSLATTAPATSDCLNYLAYNNIINKPVSIVKTKFLNGIENVIAAKDVFYKPVTLTSTLFTVLPSQENTLESNQPILMSNYTNFSVAENNGSETFQEDSRMKFKVNYANYDTRANVTEMNLNSMASVGAYIWDNQDNLIAKATNASRANIAYTSFETPLKDIYSTDDWQILPQLPNDNTNLAIKNAQYVTGGKTGKSASKAVLITSKLVSQGNYNFSCWASGNGSISVNGISQTITGGWNLYTWNLNNINQVTITNNNSLSVDELRLIPTNAQIFTYTYDPLVGMTSMTGPNGKITYYEYDGFQRLVNIKDQNGNIVKSYCYNYAGQTYGCNVPILFFTNAADSSAFTTVCGAGYTGTSVMYKVPKGQYNSTISQADADSKAFADIQSNGQAYANAHGSCLTNVYVTISSGPNYTTTDEYGQTQTTTYYTFKTYSDAQGTIPYTLQAPLSINYQINTVTTYDASGEVIPTSGQETINILTGSNQSSTGSIEINGCDGTPAKGNCVVKTVVLLPGTGYSLRSNADD